MPDCGCFHHYDLKQRGLNACQIDMDLEGKADMRRLLVDTGFARSVEVDHPATFPFTINTSISLRGVNDVAQLEVLFNYLKSTLIVDLFPRLDHCYALGPYTLFQNNSRSRSEIGSLVNQAKYQGNPEASEDLLNRLSEFIDAHPLLLESTAIIVPPNSEINSPSLTQDWASEISRNYGFRLLKAHKLRQTDSQKSKLEGGEPEETVIAGIQNTMFVEQIPQGSKVLILDDIIGSGGTMIELARALREANASKVYGLSAAKDATFTRGGIDLGKDLWS